MLVGVVVVIAALVTYMVLSGIIGSSAAAKSGHATNSGVGSLSLPGHTKVNQSAVSDTSFQVSLEAWMNSTNGSEPVSIKGLPTDKNAPEQFVFLAGTGHISFGLRTHGQMYVIKSTMSYADGLPHHVIATALNGKMQLMIDGQLVATGEYPETISL